MSSNSTTGMDASDLAAAAEPCPTPLVWHQIAQDFHASANSRLIETDRAVLKITEFGTGHPVVFLPGMCGSARLFCLTAWLLKEEFHSILVETPHFHRTPKPRQLVRETAEALSLAIEHFSPGGADIYASAFSSQVALQIMMSHPQAIRSAFLQGAWATRTLTRMERAVLEIARWSPFKLKNMPWWQTAQIENHRRWFPPFDETRFGFLLQEAGESRTCDFARQWLAAAQTDLRPMLPKIQQPVCILHCEGEGQLIAAAEAELETQLPHVRRIEMPHSGHYPYLTHPHRLVKLLKPFLTENFIRSGP